MRSPEAQLQQRAAEEAREQRARDHQRALEDDRRQSVMRRVEEEEEMRRYRHAQQLADKEVAVLRKQAEIEEVRPGLPALLLPNPQT